MKGKQKFCFFMMVMISFFVITKDLYAGIIFSDNFDTGIDSSKWYLEEINRVKWKYVEENGNGYIRSGQPINWDNRYLDILTQKDDFDDFILSYDMRFMSESWNKDWRHIYLRSDDSFNVHGYGMSIGVNVPVGDHPYVSDFYIRDMQGRHTRLAAKYNYSWDLNKWYTFKVSVVGNEMKSKWWEKGTTEPSEWFLEAVDVNNVFSQGRIGFGSYWLGITDVDNVKVESPGTETVPEPATVFLFGISLCTSIGLFHRKQIFS